MVFGRYYGAFIMIDLVKMGMVLLTSVIMLKILCGMVEMKITGTMSEKVANKVNKMDAFSKMIFGISFFIFSVGFFIWAIKL